MGADLIGYLSVGPEKFTKRQKERAVRHAKVIVEKAGEIVDLLKKAEDGLDETAAEKADKLYGGRCFNGFRSVEQEDHLPDAEGGIRLIAVMDPVKRVEDFVEWWIYGARDTVSRRNPSNRKERIVFCGEMSWGDAPEGEGFEQMRYATWLDIPNYLGIR